jgi:hypothetical protein
LAGYGEFSQPNSRLTSPAVPYRQQQQPAYAADASSNQQYGSYGWYGGGAAAVPGVGSSNGTMPAGCGWQLNGASNAGSSSIIGSYSGAGSTVNQGKYSSLMQQLIAQQQQQQQQQIYLTSGIGSRNNSANIRPALDAMDACSRDGGVQYGAQQQDACWSPRTGAAAGGGGSCKYDAAGGSYSTSGSGYAVMQSSSMGQGYQAATSAAGSLGAAAVRTSNPGVFPALAVVGGSSLPKPVGGAAFISCKGAFGGKTIVQPPGKLKPSMRELKFPELQVRVKATVCKFCLILCFGTSELFTDASSVPAAVRWAFKLQHLWRRMRRGSAV